MKMAAPRKPRSYYTERVHRSVLRAAQRKHQPRITYRSRDGIRHGFLVSDTGKIMMLRLIGDLSNTRIDQRHRGFVKLVDNGKRTCHTQS